MTIPIPIHRTVVIVRDLLCSLHFRCDGIGLGALQDRSVERDWSGRFGAPGRKVHASFFSAPGGSERARACSRSTSPTARCRAVLPRWSPTSHLLL
jgi:hypothetical protein